MRTPMANAQGTTDSDPIQTTRTGPARTLVDRHAAEWRTTQGCAFFRKSLCAAASYIAASLSCSPEPNTHGD